LTSNHYTLLKAPPVAKVAGATLALT